jgi:hypothetical protein
LAFALGHQSGDGSAARSGDRGEDGRTFDGTTLESRHHHLDGGPDGVRNKRAHDRSGRAAQHRTGTTPEGSYYLVFDPILEEVDDTSNRTTIEGDGLFRFGKSGLEVS